MARWLDWLEIPVEGEDADGKDLRERLRGLGVDAGKLREPDVRSILDLLVREWTESEG